MKSPSAEPTPAAGRILNKEKEWELEEEDTTPGIAIKQQIQKTYHYRIRNQLSSLASLNRQKSDVQFHRIQITQEEREDDTTPQIAIEIE